MGVELFGNLLEGLVGLFGKYFEPGVRDLFGDLASVASRRADVSTSGEYGPSSGVEAAPLPMK